MHNFRNGQINVRNIFLCMEMDLKGGKKINSGCCATLRGEGESPNLRLGKKVDHLSKILKIWIDEAQQRTVQVPLGDTWVSTSLPEPYPR